MTNKSALGLGLIIAAAYAFGLGAGLIIHVGYAFVLIGLFILFHKISSFSKNEASDC